MSSIVVADDQSILREPIAATLRREGYQTLCARNGVEVLALIRQACPDLILLDIAMPVMDGINCLRRLRDDAKTRGIPVIMLTAAAERQMVRTAVEIGIQGYLLKSNFSLDAMLAQVRKTLDVRPGLSGVSTPECREPPGEQEPTTPKPRLACIGKSEVLASIRQDLDINAIPAVLQHVIAITNSSRSCIDEVAEAVQQDQALAIRILRIANSSFFGIGQIAKTLPDAARRIGMSGVRDAAVAIMAIERFAGSDTGGINTQYFWEHSLASAVLAQLLDEAIGSENAGYAFLAAFLHDIGRPILSSKFPDQYQSALAIAAEQNTDLMTAEREVFGLTHVDVTDDFLCRLGVHSVVRQAASLHSLGVEGIKRSAGDSTCALCVALANRMAHMLVLGDSGSSMLAPVADYAKALNLDRERISSVMQEAVTRSHQTKLFYASQSQETLQEDLPSQITRTAGVAAKLVFVNRGGVIEPLQVFFERLGWLDARSPKLAVINAASERELGRRMAELKELEGAMGGRLPLLVTSPGASVGLSPPDSEERVWTRTSMPGRYQSAVNAIADLCAASATTSGVASAKRGHRQADTDQRWEER